ncbi:MAG TPA: protein rep [Kamptonema sp.]|nr:protein rep [Kamptonema sp.]
MKNHPFYFSTGYKRLLACKNNSLIVAQLYEELGMNSYARRIINCSPDIKCFLVNAGTDSEYYSFLSESQCRSRHCTLCQLFRSMRMRRLLQTRLHPNMKSIFLTLTQQNCKFEDLASELDKINYGFKLFWNGIQRKSDKPFVGCFRSTEVSVESKRYGYFHPHLHLLVHVVPDYFYTYREKGYDCSWLSNQWRNYLNLDYNPIVHISGVKDRKAILEVSKYVTKPASYKFSNPSEILKHLHFGLHRRKLFNTAGTIREIIGAAVDSIDDDSSTKELTRIGDNNPDFSIVWNGENWRVD